MSKVRRKTNSFATALQDAAKRYAKATKEREAAVLTLTALDAEIPALQQTIAALERQLKPTQTERACHFSETYGDITKIPPSPEQYRSPVSPENLTEDDTLPPIDGEPIVED